MAATQTANVRAAKATNFRWFICGLLFIATTVNYMDRQVLSLTWKDFIAPEFHWTDTDYGNITAVFSIVYALSNFFVGRFIDWMGTLKGYLWAIFIWSLGACLHAGCGWATEHVLGFSSVSGMVDAAGVMASTVAMTSVYFFIAARIVLAVGESGNFPAAIKVTAEYFPKKDRAYATSLFNAGATIGALVAPLSIPPLARYFQNIGVGNGWEMAFIIIGGLGFIWMGLWLAFYKKPSESKYVNDAELAYIEQDSHVADETPRQEAEAEDSRDAVRIPFWKCFRYPQTWAVIFGRFLTDGVWWFFLFWIPAYISDVYGLPSDSGMAQMLIFVLYAITMLSIYGGKLPTIIMNRTGRNPYSARMRAMFIFALFPLLAIFAQPLGVYSYWYPVIIIGLCGAAHQSWSANIYTVVSDMFPKSTVGSIIGIGGMAAGLSSFLINLISGRLFDYAAATDMQFMGFTGKPAGYFIIFCFCGVAYLLGWCVMKILVPRYKIIKA